MKRGRKNKLNNERGDTLVEVLVSTVILSIVLAGAFALSARALRFNQAATERTEVVNKMREQAEMLRYINAHRSGPTTDAWNKIVSFSSSSTSFYFDIYNDPANPSAGIKDPTALGAAYVKAYVAGVDTYGPSGVVDIFDIRIVPNPGADYIDFATYATWDGIGDIPNQEAGNVIRLNTVTY